MRTVMAAIASLDFVERLMGVTRLRTQALNKVEAQREVILSS
jgi:hypothetical protein